MSLILDALKKSEQQRRAGPAGASRPVRPPMRPHRSVRRPWVAAGVILMLMAAVLVFWFLPDSESPQPPPTAAQPLSEMNRKSPVAAPRLPAQGLEDGKAAAAPDRETAMEPRGDEMHGRSDEESTPAPDVPVQTPAIADGAPLNDLRSAVRNGGDAQRQVNARSSVGVQESALPPSALPTEPAPLAAGKAANGPAALDLRAQARENLSTETDGAAVTEENDLPALFSTLPYTEQKGILPLELQVHVYDRDPQRRFVMLNGTMYVEGADVKPGLRIEGIVPQGLIMTWNGRRFLFSPGD